MCEIFPEVKNCCSFASIRVGMLLIAILSISTGAITLGVTEQLSNFGYDKVVSVYGNVTDTPAQALSELTGIVTTTIIIMSVVFMLAGVCLLFATLADQEGYAQAFVWLIFLNIILGILMIIAITYECLMRTTCYLDSMDWLSGAITLILVVFYLLRLYYLTWSSGQRNQSPLPTKCIQLYRKTQLVPACLRNQYGGATSSDSITECYWSSHH